MTRIYQAITLNVGDTLCLEAKAAHHVARVLRAACNDELVLFNGLGGEYASVITRIDKKGVEVQVLSFNAREVEPPVAIYLAQGIARGEKMDFIIQKAVELGVKGIIPLLTERGTVKLNREREESRRKHWQSVIISACEQSGRNFLPEIAAPQHLPTWLPQVQADLRLVLSPHVKAALPHTPVAPQSVVLLVGPEGGLSREEIAAACAQQFLPLNIGPRVLRTETASVAAIALMQYCYGDFAV